MKNDFERTWQNKLEQGIKDYASDDLRLRVLQGGETLSDQSDRSEVIQWTGEVMAVLIDSCPDQDVRNILTGCACHYPADDLKSLKEHLEKG